MPRLALVGLAMVLLLTATGCTYHETNREMKDGHLIMAKGTEDGLEFAFSTQTGEVVDSNGHSLNFKAIIDNQVEGVKVKYQVLVRNAVKTRLNGEKNVIESSEDHFVDSNRRIELIMSASTYRELMLGKVVEG